MKNRNQIKLLNAAALCIILSANVFACPVCRRAVNKTIYADFWQTFLVLLAPLFLLTVIGVGLFYAGELQQKLLKISKWHKTDFR